MLSSLLCIGCAYRVHRLTPGTALHHLAVKLAQRFDGYQAVIDHYDRKGWKDSPPVSERELLENVRDEVRSIKNLMAELGLFDAASESSDEAS